MSPANFNPRTHVGCDLAHSAQSGCDCLFQSTHPRGVRLGAIFQGWSDPIFQSTHPRGVRHGPAAQCLRRRISIHAPTWGATRLPHQRPGRFSISIHAPTWGATGERLHTVQRVAISIHAPTWGATYECCSFCVIAIFQSTHPRGVRRAHLVHLFLETYFNPRTHVGCDRRKGRSKTPL